MAETAYKTLERRFRRLSLLGEASGFLEWDRATLMPKGGAEARAEQITELALIRHAALVDAEIAALLDEAEAGAAALGSWQGANLAAMRRR